jgi:hypothetical protein
MIKTGQIKIHQPLLHYMGLSDNPICRKCVTEEETSVHILCACEALALLRHSYLCPFFLDAEDIRKLNIRAIWKFVKEQVNVEVKVKQSHYSPGEALRVPEG